MGLSRIERGLTKDCQSLINRKEGVTDAKLLNNIYKYSLLLHYDSNKLKTIILLE